MAAVFDVVAAWPFHGRTDPCAHIVDDRSQISVGDVAHYDHLALHVFSPDRIRPAFFANVSEHMKREPRTRWRRHEGLANRFEIAHGRRGEPHTAHTLNPVPLVYVNDNDTNRKIRSGGRICDVAPTMLELLGLPLPKAMTGHSLFEKE